MCLASELQREKLKHHPIDNPGARGRVPYPVKPRDIFLAKLHRGAASRAATGSATSMVTADLMDKIGVFFPEAHTDGVKMAALAAAGFTELGFDNVMPLFSVWHEAAALGCPTDWGHRTMMPDGKAIRESVDEPFEVPPIS